MRFRQLAVLAALAASLTLGACGTQSGGAELAACTPPETPYHPSAPASDGLSVPPLQFTCKQLPNGLRIYAMPDKDTASVSVQVWYKVGSKDDPPGRSGFAHLFEHLMFKSTTNMPPETMDRLTEDAGGFNNASTWDDFTNYYEVVPANNLQRVLWAEAERMGSLVVDEANFVPEREVVKNELRQNYLGSPYGRLFLYLTRTAFSVHPYGRPGIGSEEQLDASSIQDVREFHAAYYRPDNAVLVVSGNFNQTQLDKWVSQYFGPIKTPDRSIPRVAVREPARTQAEDFIVYEPNVPLPAVAVTWPAPAADDPDIAAWMVLDAILTEGQSSRLYQSLVYDQRIAAQVFSSFEVREQPGSYSLIAILSDGQSPQDGVAALKAEIEKVRSGLPTAAEIDEAKTELMVETISNRETADGRADELARSVILFGDPGASDKLLAKLQAVTPEDVQKIAARIMDDDQSVTLRYLPESMQNGASEDEIEDAPTIQATAISIPTDQIPVYSLAPEATRIQPPEAGPAVSAVIPGSEEKTLDNGLRVVVASRPGLPLVSASLRIYAGDAVDPADKSGLASMTADLATRGTMTRSASDIAQQIESLGAQLGAGSGDDASNVSISSLSSKASEAFAIMADVVINPAFAQGELDRARSEQLDNLKVSMRQPPSVASMVMTRVLYGDAPYGQIATMRSISALDRASIVNFHDTWWRPDNAVLVITGNVTPDQGFELAETAFGGWVKPGAAAPDTRAPDKASDLSQAQVTVVDIPQIGQATVTVGLPGPSRSDADYFPVLVVNNVLGGGYSARLNSEIRIKRGLSYGARSGLPARKGRSTLVASAQTGNDNVAEVISLIRSELSRLGAEPIPNNEIDARKAVLIGSFGRSVETNAGLAGQLSALAQFSIPLDKLANYSSDIGSVTPEQAMEAARAWFDPSKALVVAVGDAGTFWVDVTKSDDDVRRIEIDKLNLDSAKLE